MSIDPLAQPLPPHPSLEQQRKRARELLNAARAHDPRALLRFVAALPRLADRTAAEAAAATLSLHEAQLVIARECGFPSWPKLKSHIESRPVRLTFERYNERARRVLFFSRHEAGESGSATIETEHVLLGLLRDVEGAAGQILLRAQVSRAQVQKVLDLLRESRPAIPVSIEIPFGAETKRVLQCAADEADRLSHREIGVEHLLLAMLHQKRSAAGGILAKSGLRLDDLREQIGQLMAMTPLGWTSRWVAAARALETESANPLFRDPLARDLAGRAGFELLSSMREALGVSATTGPEPYFSIRTRFFDDAIVAAVRRSSIRQVVILAAGMDTRAFRIDWPSGVVLFEIDRNEIFDHKEAILERSHAQSACDRRIVRADLTAGWSAAILSAGFDPARPTAILVEGLLPFLSEHAATELFTTIATLASSGSCLALDAINEEMLVSSYLSAYLKKLRAFGCPWRFGVDHPGEFLAEHGWQATIFGPGEREANYGRWPYPLPSPTFAGLPMKIPRAFLILARRIGGAGEKLRASDGPGDSPLMTEYKDQQTGQFIDA